MIPVPNLISGVLIGIFNTHWTTVLFASVIWGLVFLILVSFKSNDARLAFVQKGYQGKKLGISKNAWYWIIEYWTGFATSLFFGTIAYFIMKLFR